VLYQRITTDTVSDTEKGLKKLNLLGLDLDDLKVYFESIGQKPFRATQLLKWIHQFNESDFTKMTNIGKTLQADLLQSACIAVPEIVAEQVSDDGTIKWLLKLDDGNCIETVFIPENSRGTLCVSSQVGCALDCSFCSTAQQGFNRNLDAAEIISQVWVAHRSFAKSPKQERVISNVVFMGMGEPLLNFDSVTKAVRIMLDDNAYGLSKRRVTISTAGVVPALKKLRDYCDVSLAISLHAANDALRDQLIPLNQKYPIKELIAACQYYFSGDTKMKQFTIEYVLLDKVNDSIQHAHELVKLLKKLPCKVNLIPFNPFPNSLYKRSSASAIERFKNVLVQAGLVTVTRKTRGDDIDAACGQLAGRVKDKTKRQFQKKQQFEVNIDSIEKKA